MCCLHLQPNVSAEIEIRPAAVATAALAEILEQLRTGVRILVPNRATLIDYAQPPDASVLLTKTLCIDFLADTLVRQLDTQAENIKQVKELLIQVNNKLRDKDSITVSVVRTPPYCEIFRSHPLVVEERTHRVSKSAGPLSSPAHPQTRAVDVGQAHTWRAG
jgi:hypothetical protein